MKPETESGAIIGSQNARDPPRGFLVEDAATGAFERIRTLIADDSAVCRWVAARLLARLPQVEMVGAAQDGVDAVALAASTRPDLVLMDLQMPRLDGLEATRQIRAEFPGVRVILTTFSDSEGSKAASDTSGVDRFISKECLRDQLPGAIAQLFSGARWCHGG